ncbi:hypothetical protein [Erythrobacter alti]|uniref:hypothetical protein n=1 Tax=Erythrobacter alti TaxID=1896145 RepID=UPI0030F457E0
MTWIVPLLALIAAPVAPAPPEPAEQQAAPQLSLQHRMLVRCSAAFAMVAYGQENGQADALQYPDMRDRGEEFFVRASAQVMDEAQLDRVQIEAALSAEAQDLWDSGSIGDVMPACLALLPE